LIIGNLQIKGCSYLERERERDRETEREHVRNTINRLNMIDNMILVNTFMVG